MEVEGATFVLVMMTNTSTVDSECMILFWFSLFAHSFYGSGDVLLVFERSIRCLSFLKDI